MKIALPLRVYKGLSKLTAESEMGQALKGMRSCGFRIMWGDSESWAEPRNLHFIQPGVKSRHLEPGKVDGMEKRG